VGKNFSEMYYLGITHLCKDENHERENQQKKNKRSILSEFAYRKNILHEGVGFLRHYFFF